MTGVPHDFYTPGQSPREERETYFDMLKKVDEVADILMSRELPIARDVYYRISDPTVISLLKAPAEFALMNLASVRFEFQENKDGDMLFSTTCLVLEFEEGDCRVYEPQELEEIVRYDFIPAHAINDPRDASISTGSMGVKEFSNLVASLLRLWDDPERSDFTRFDMSDSRNEMIEILESQEHTSSSKVLEYVCDNAEIVITTEDGHTREVSVGQMGMENDPYSVTLRTTFDTNAHAQELYIEEADASSQRQITAIEIQAFRDILDDMIEQLAPKDESFEQLYEKDDKDEPGDEEDATQSIASSVVELLTEDDGLHVELYGEEPT